MTTQLRLGLSDEVYAQVDRHLAAFTTRFEADYPGDATDAQPVHTVYVPADRLRADVCAAWGRTALSLLDDVAPEPASFADVFDLSEQLAAEILPRVRAKLAAEPIEDLRVDFEDGFGLRSDTAEDAAVVVAAGELASAVAAGAAPRRVGLRMRGMEPAVRRRGLRTLDGFLGELVTAGQLPEDFVVALPKVTGVPQVEAFVDVCAALERAYGLAEGRLRFEVQVETPQAVLGADGVVTAAGLVHAGASRIVGLHYGTYDYSAACGIAPALQSADHPAAEYAKSVLQVAAAGTGVQVVDGSSNVLPVGPPEEVRAAWRLHAGLVRRALDRGFYQGWDLHAGQLVSRYAATFAFYRTGWRVAAERLQRYLDRRDSGVLDEPATAQAIAAYLLRARRCGALDAGELRAGLDVDDSVLAGLRDRRIG